MSLQYFNAKVRETEAELNNLRYFMNLFV
jgi:hypothetical protein